MSFLSDKIINLEDNSSSDERSVGSDVEEIVQWDRELLQTKTYTTAFTILVSNRKYDGPKLDKQKKHLLQFIDCPADEYFKRRSKEAKAFIELKAASKLGWKTEASRARVWNLRFVANKLALLLVLRRQVHKENEENEKNQTVTCAQKSVRGTPKATGLKRALIKLWGAYEKSLKNYVAAETKKANIVHHTPSLSYQLNGKRAQDLVPWMSWAKCQSNCPACVHVLMMPLQSHEKSNAEDAHQCAVAEASLRTQGWLLLLRTELIWERRWHRMLEVCRDGPGEG